MLELKSCHADMVNESIGRSLTAMGLLKAFTRRRASTSRGHLLTVQALPMIDRALATEAEGSGRLYSRSTSSTRSGAAEWASSEG